MKTIVHVLLQSCLAMFLLCIMFIGFGCGSSMSPTDDLSTKQVSDDVGGTTYFIPPTPDSGAFIYGGFTAKCDGYIIGGWSYKAVYTLLKSDGTTYYTVTKTSYPNYQQAIPVPDSYFGYMQLQVRQYARHSDYPYAWVECGADNVNIFVNTM